MTSPSHLENRRDRTARSSEAGRAGRFNRAAPSRHAGRGRWVAWARKAATILALLLVMALLLLMVVVPRAMGWVPLNVLSGSMEPAIPVGSQVVVDPVSEDPSLPEVAPGDVVTFMPYPNDPTLVTHRVISRSTDTAGVLRLQTQGDANTVADAEAVTAQQVRGIVRYHVPYAGYVATALDRDQRQLATWGLAAALLLYALWQVASLVRDRPREQS